MFKGIANFMSLMKQAKNIGGRLQNVSEELKSKRAVGSAGGGMVEVEVNGLGEVLACRIEAGLLQKQDKEMLEDLLVAACNQAAAKAKQLHADAMSELTEGMNLPGLDEALAKVQGGDVGGDAPDEDDEQDETTG